MEVSEKDAEKEKTGKKAGFWQLLRSRKLATDNVEVTRDAVTFFALPQQKRIRIFSISLTGSGINTYPLFTSYFWSRFLFDGDVRPSVTNTHDLGAIGERWATVYLVNSPNVSSDIRFKDNIKDVPYGLKDIEKVNPISFTRKGDDKVRLGFSAQELKGIIPEMVTDNGDELSITPDALVPVLVNAVKELSDRVKELEDKMV